MHPDAVSAPVLGKAKLEDFSFQMEPNVEPAYD